MTVDDGNVGEEIIYSYHSLKTQQSNAYKQRNPPLPPFIPHHIPNFRPSTSHLFHHAQTFAPLIPSNLQPQIFASTLIPTINLEFGFGHPSSQLSLRLERTDKARSTRIMLPLLLRLIQLRQDLLR
jgi:hypothetical protein